MSKFMDTDNDLFDYLKSKVDLKELLISLYGVKFPRTYHRNNCNVSCIFHGPDKKPSMNVNFDYNTFKCHACQKTGTVIDVAMHYYNTSDALYAAKQLLDKYPHLKEKAPLNKEVVDYEYKNYTDVYNFVSNKWMNYYLKGGDDYYGKRGFSNEVINRYLLGKTPEVLISKTGEVVNFKKYVMGYFKYIPEHVLDTYDLFDKYGNFKLANRYLFPIKDAKHNVIAFSGRAIDPTALAKYINTKDTKYFHKSQVLYNYDVAIHVGTSTYVVEGYADALSLITSGVTNVVASMGTAFTDEHIKMLKYKKIILALDNDSAGIESTRKLCEENPGLYVLVYGKDFKWKDFNDALISGLDIKNFLESSKVITAPEFVFNYYRDNMDLSQLSVREEFEKIVFNYLKHEDISEVMRDYIKIKFARLMKGRRAQNN